MSWNCRSAAPCQVVIIFSDETAAAEKKYYDEKSEA
jgi:hypothetical protein